MGCDVYHELSRTFFYACLTIVIPLKLQCIFNRFQDIKLSMLRSSTAYPTLKGRAAEIKHLVRALRDVWSIHREENRASDEYVLHAQIALLLQKFDEIDSVLDAHDPINYPCLPPGPQADFEKACWDAMSIMNFL